MRRIKCRWKSLVSRGELEIFQKRGRGSWQGRGEEKIEGRVVTLKETMTKVIVTDFEAKKVESLVKLSWETSICFFIKTIKQQPVSSTLWQKQITVNLFAIVPQAQKCTGFKLLRSFVIGVLDLLFIVWPNAFSLLFFIYTSRINECIKICLVLTFRILWDHLALYKDLRISHDFRSHRFHFSKDSRDRHCQISAYALLKQHTYV